MRWREVAVFRAMCDCGAEADVDRINVIVDVPTREGGTAAQKADVLDVDRIGWTCGPVRPEGRPVLTAAGTSTVDPFRDLDADIARKVGVAQRTLRCPACSEKAKAADIFRSAGAVITGPDGRPVQ